MQLFYRKWFQHSLIYPSFERVKNALTSFDMQITLKYAAVKSSCIHVE